MILELKISITGDKYVSLVFGKATQLVVSHATAAAVVVVSVTFGCGAVYLKEEHPRETSCHWKSCFTLAE